MTMKVSKHVTAECDGPQCFVKLNFTEEEPDSYQDSMWRFITIVEFDGTNHLFCSSTCATEYLRKVYRPLLSPREKQAGEKEHADDIVNRVIPLQPGKVIDFPARRV